MAKRKPFNSKLVKKDNEDLLTRDLNDFVRAVLLELSSEFGPDGGEPISPIDTGFFASSWTASTQRPRPNQDRMNFAPWKNIEPTRKGEKSPQAEVNPRFINDIKFNFKPFSKVFIGNRSEYAASALGSPRSRVAKYSGTLRPLVNEIFSDKKVKIGIGTKPFKGGQGGIGPFADPTREFVDYTNL